MRLVTFASWRITALREPRSFAQLLEGLNDPSGDPSKRDDSLLRPAQSTAGDTAGDRVATDRSDAGTCRSPTRRGRGT